MQDFQSMANIASFWSSQNSTVELIGQLSENNKVYYNQRFANNNLACDKLASIVVKWEKKGGYIEVVSGDTICLLNTKRNRVASYWINMIPHEKMEENIYKD